MNAGHIYFEIQADDPQRAIEFYVQVFGWTFTEVEGLPIPYWTIATGGSRGGLLKRPAKTPPGRSAALTHSCARSRSPALMPPHASLSRSAVSLRCRSSRYRILAGRAISSIWMAIRSESSKLTPTRNSSAFPHARWWYPEPQCLSQNPLSVPRPSLPTSASKKLSSTSTDRCWWSLAPVQARPRF